MKEPTVDTDNTALAKRIYNHPATVTSLDEAYAGASDSLVTITVVGLDVPASQVKRGDVLVGRYVNQN